MMQQIPATEIIYPDSDGKPMADNTEQFQWIVTLKENLELMYADDPDVFVAGDLLWYPIEGNNTPKTWEIYRPDGSRFLTYVKLGQKLEQTSQQLEQTSQQLEIAQARADRLAAQLRELGVDPEAI